MFECRLGGLATGVVDGRNAVYGVWGRGDGVWGEELMVR